MKPAYITIFTDMSNVKMNIIKICPIFYILAAVWDVDICKHTWIVLLIVKIAHNIQNIPIDKT